MVLTGTTITELAETPTSASTATQDPSSEEQEEVPRAPSTIITILQRVVQLTTPPMEEAVPSLEEAMEVQEEKVNRMVPEEEQEEPVGTPEMEATEKMPRAVSLPPVEQEEEEEEVGQPTAMARIITLEEVAVLEFLVKVPAEAPPPPAITTSKVALDLEDLENRTEEVDKEPKMMPLEIPDLVDLEPFESSGVTEEHSPPPKRRTSESVNDVLLHRRPPCSGDRLVVHTTYIQMRRRIWAAITIHYY